MSELWPSIVSWFMGLGERYGVNPLVFGSIYVGAIPFFTLCLVWAAGNYRRRKPLALPLLGAGFWFISAYLYLFVAGRNLPWWVYAAALALLVFGAYSGFQNLRSRIKRAQGEGVS